MDTESRARYDGFGDRYDTPSAVGVGNDREVGLRASGAYLSATLGDGTSVLLRRVQADDKACLTAGFARLSPEGRAQRFHGPVARLTAEQLRYLTEIDGWNHCAWAAIGGEDAQLGMGVGRYVRLAERPDAAEVALTVLDDHRRNGVGTLLLGLLWASARRAGITSLQALVRADNHPARSMFAALGAIGRGASRGEIELDLDLSLDRLPPNDVTSRLRSVVERAQVMLPRIEEERRSS